MSGDRATLRVVMLVETLTADGVPFEAAVAEARSIVRAQTERDRQESITDRSGAPTCPFVSPNSDTGYCRCSQEDGHAAPHRCQHGDVL